MRRRDWLKLTSAATVLGPLTARARAAGTSDARVELVVGRWLEGEPGAASQRPGTSPLKSPFGVAFEASGSMIVVELEGGRVHRVGAGGTVETIAGDGSEGYAGDGGPARAAVFNGMHNVAIRPDGTILIADSFNRVVRGIDPDSGVIRTVIGTGRAGFDGDGGPADEATFQDVMCVTIEPSSGRLLLTDIQNRRIRAVDGSTGVVTTIAGNGAKGVPTDGSKAADSPLVDPRAAAAGAEGRVYILERGGHALRVVEPDGTIRTVAGDGEAGLVDGPGSQARFNGPKHLAVDDRGRVFIADDVNAAIRLYDPATGVVSTVLGRGPIRLSHPHGVCVEKGWLYVADSGNDRVLRMPVPDR